MSMHKSSYHKIPDQPFPLLPQNPYLFHTHRQPTSALGLSLASILSAPFYADPLIPCA